ncbi:unnamed protein product [Gordionus sp. m RMFG-2023]
MSSTVAPIRRNLKNVIKNYSDAQVKVREATSNDPWGPSSSLMTDIADLTYNVVAFSEIMQMIWKRLNDSGKNWRHVYKALSLLEYIIKTGNEKVAQQCKENIFAIQTLKDFQYIEENKDQGLNVREKAKQIVALLKDDERLKNERTRALKAKERFAQGTSISFQMKKDTDTPEDFKDGNTEWEAVRPSNQGEEDLQFQLAIAMSKEEAENEKKILRGDDLRLQLALSQSEQELKKISNPLESENNALIDLDFLDPPQNSYKMPKFAHENNSIDPWSIHNIPITLPVFSGDTQGLISSTNNLPYQSCKTLPLIK